MNNFDSIHPPKIEISANSNPTKPTTSKVRKPFSSAKKIITSLLIAVLIACISLGAYAGVRASSLTGKIFVGKKFSFFEKIKMVFGSSGSSSEIFGEKSGQINILLLGVGGEGHDGPYLTDTIMLAQFRPRENTAVLVSVPRDLYVPLPENPRDFRKINAVFAEGLGKDKDFLRAGEWAMKSVSELSGLDIKYFAVVDFSGFENIIDNIGGVDVTVERTFTDAEFPDNGIGYLSPLTFKEGLNHFNGEKALQFARSRHGNNNEGSDFARSLRQQKVISAFKTKLFRLNILSDAGKINAMLSTIADHFHTNLEPAQVYKLYTLSKEHSLKEIYSVSLDEQTGLLCPKILEDSGAWVLLKCPGVTAESLKNFFKDSFLNGQFNKEKPVVWLAKGAASTSRFSQLFAKLGQSGFTVYEVSYLPEKTINADLIFQANSKPASAEILKTRLNNAVEVFLPPPGLDADPKKVDLVIILGKE